MAIQRYNIFDLIGAHRKRYHSCLLTSYSFNFSFFENRLMPVLSRSNIRNINVWVDGKMLDESLFTSSGSEYKTNNSYSITPIFEQGVFHPKIALFTGLSQGLLIIGSGNLTSSGISCNDEIWGAFHLDSLKSPHTPIFAAAWQYLNSYFPQVKGFNKEKINWIRKYSPWIEELDSYLPSGFSDLDGVQKVYFISNRSDASVYKQLIDVLPKEDCQQITIVSPYFDKGGKVVSSLQEDFSPEETICLVEKEQGTLPTDFDQKIYPSVKFSHWKDCKKDFDPEKNRLHAKAFHFQYKNGEEYLFLGSANASIQAFGNQTKVGVNAEAGILLYQKEQKSYLNKLGISLSNTRYFSLDSCKPTNNILTENIHNKRHEVQIVHAELEGNSLQFFLKDVLKIEMEATVLNDQNKLIESFKLLPGQSSYRFAVSSPLTCYKLSLCNQRANEVSNVMLIHRIDQLLKCNPDPNHEKISALLNQDYPNAEGVSKLLKYLEFSWVDDERSFSVKGATKNSKVKALSNQEEKEKEWEVLSEDEFNQIDIEAMYKRSKLLEHSNIKIADFLNLLGKGITNYNNEMVEEDMEQRLISIEMSPNADNDIQSGSIFKKDAILELKAINNFFKKLDKAYSKRLKSFFASSVINDLPDDKITLKNFSSMLVALEVLHIYSGKYYQVGEESFYQQPYFKYGSFNDSYKTIKGFINTILCPFLILSNIGAKQYEYETINQKVASYKQEIFEIATFWLLNLPVSGKKEVLRDLVLLDLLNFLDISGNYDEKAKNITISLYSRLDSANFSSPHFQEHLDYYLETILASYLKWKDCFDNINSRKKEITFDIENLSGGDILFNSKLGFCLFEGMRKDKQIPYLNLSKLGFPYIDNKPEINNIPFVNKAVLFVWI